MTQDLFAADLDREFSMFNGLAFDLARLEARKEDTRIPCWLCLTEEAKDKYRKDFLDFARINIPAVRHMSDQDIESHMNRNYGLANHFLNLWRQAELEKKKAREEEHDPTAFFA